MVTLDRRASVPLAHAMAAAGLGPRSVLEWGRDRSYEELLDHPGSLTVLDAPHPLDSDTLVQTVGALRLLTSATVLVPEVAGVSAELLEAGAVNVLRRSSPPAELAARISADQRWLAPTGRVRSCASRPEAARQQSQRVLLELMIRRKSPFCCHDVRRLLGSPSQPLSLRATRARISRLLPRLAEHGLSLRTNSSWGREVYEVVPAHTRAEPGAPRLSY